MSIVVISEERLEEIIMNTFQQAKQIVVEELSERYMTVPQASFLINESQSNIHSRIKAGEFKNVHYKGVHCEILYSELMKVKRMRKRKK